MNAMYRYLLRQYKHIPETEFISGMSLFFTKRQALLEKIIR
jgi:hypothetical protein